MKIYFDKQSFRKYQKLGNKNHILKVKIKKALQLLEKDPVHPSLRLHKLSGKRKTAWSISVTMDLRIIFQFKGKDIFIIDIGKHDEVY